MPKGTVTVRIIGDAGGLQQALGKTQSALDRFGQGMVRAGRTISIGIGLPLLAAGKTALDAASDLNESQSKVNVVFGKSAKAIQAWADTAAKSFGMSERAALEAAGTLGNLFVALKLPQVEASKMSRKMVELAGDLASFNNVDPTEALDALRAGLIGETEPLRRFGVNLNDATLRQQALAMGLVKTTKEVLPASVKAQAAYALILEQTKTAQGDFARTSDGVANRQRIVKAQFEDAAATLGQKLLPIGQKLLAWASDLATRFSSLSPQTQDMIIKGAGLAIALGPVVTVTGKLITTISGVSKALMFLAANPIGLAIVAIAAIALAIVKFKDEIRSAVVSGIQFFVDKLFAAAEWILRGAAKAFGWIPVVGDDLKKAARDFERFRDRVNASLDGIKGHKEIRVTVVGPDFIGPLAPWQQRAAGPQRAPGRAHGGPVSAGRPYTVGEKGPEMFVPRTSGAIVPNSALRQVHIHLEGSTFYQTSDFDEAVEHALSRSVRARMAV